jgi:frataxin
MFQTEADFHAVADSTLETIQETMELLLERVQSEEFEVDYASGVLTMAVPPHGTWVLNKQTPNRQIWWSSPVSGPRRYEYENEMWTYTRSDGGADTLGQALAKEMKELYPQLTKDTDLHGLLLQ